MSHQRPDDWISLSPAGRLNLVLPPADASPGLAVRAACAGVGFADGTLSYSPSWTPLGCEPLQGQVSPDRGPFSGLTAAFAVGETLRVEWSMIAYPQRAMAAVWMAATNVSRRDQLLMRLIPLQIDPRDDGRLDAPGMELRGALVLNNQMWFGAQPVDWRVPVPEGSLTDGYWSVALAEPNGPALIAGIGEPANSFAGIGFTRAGDRFGLTLSGWLWSDLEHRPLRLRPGQTFALTRFLLLTGPNAHTGLTRYADHVAQFAGIHLRHPPYAGIFSAYGGDPTGEDPSSHPLTEERINTFRTVLDQYLKPYGLDTFKTQFAGLSSGPPPGAHPAKWPDPALGATEAEFIERVYESGFTPDVYDSRQDFPHGIEAHVRDLKRRGYRPALVCRPFLNIRSGSPDNDRLAADLFEMTVKRWGYEYLMFDFNSADYETEDDTHTMAEGIRSRFRAVRERVGPDVFIEACMVPPGPVLGLADGYRHAGDWRGGIEPNLVREASTRYYYHGRWFQLDHEFFDPQLFPFTWGAQGTQGIDMSLDRVRLWTSFGALTGFSWLTGGCIEHVSPERWDIFTRALPVYGRCARPLDLLEHDPPRLWLLDIQAAGGLYQVLGVFNWSEQPATERIKVEVLGRDAGGDRLLFDFWAQRVLGPTREFEVALPPCSCAVYLVHRLNEGLRWVGTDRHVTGACGLEDLKVIASGERISGRCVGPADSHQYHYLYLPEGLVPVASRNATFEVPQYRVLRVGVELDETGWRGWSVRLKRGPRIL